MRVARTRRLAAPRPVAVTVGEGNRPLTVGGRPVEAVREEWFVEDRWWTDEPLRRHYYELVLADGRNVVVYRDRDRCTWFAHRA